MMNINQEYIRQLITEKLTGTISDDDRLYLEECILLNKEAQMLWEEMEKKWEEVQGNLILSQSSAEFALERVKQGVKPRATLSAARLAQWSIAAAVIVTLVVAWPLIYKKNPVVSHTRATKVKMPNQIELVLGNGKSVNISAQPQTINIDQVSLKSSAGVLKYTGGSVHAEQLNTLNIPEQADYKIILSDKTVVWLNSSSSLRFPFTFSGKTREVYLEGEAYFEVSKNPTLPFLVHTPKTTIRVLGTSFNVNTYDPGIVKTSLVEGKVETIGLNGDSLVLRPGFEALYDDTSKKFKKKSFDPQYVLSWMEGSYLFNNVPLANLSGPLERWFGITVVQADKRVSSKTLVSGIIEKGKLKEFLENLKASTGIKYTLKNNVLHFWGD